MLKEWLKFALALLVCTVLFVLLLWLAIYCRDRAENDAILPTLSSRGR